MTEKVSGNLLLLSLDTLKICFIEQLRHLYSVGLSHRSCCEWRLVWLVFFSSTSPSVQLVHLVHGSLEHLLLSLNLDQTRLAWRFGFDNAKPF